MGYLFTISRDGILVSETPCMSKEQKALELHRQDLNLVLVPLSR